MEVIADELQLKIVRKRTDTALFVSFLTMVLPLIPLLVGGAPALIVALFGAVALAGAFATTMIMMARQHLFGLALSAVWLTAETIIYFAWLLPLLRATG